MPASPQATLALESGRKHRFANYIAGPNQPTISALQQWLADPQGDICLLQGPLATGKSHLLQAACAHWREAGRPWALVPLAAGLMLPAELAGPGGLLAIDDLQALNPEQALALARAIDGAREGRWRLLLASQMAVEDLRLPFEDLRSRLQWGARLPLRGLDEAGLVELLQQRAAELGVNWPQRNSDYLIRRLPRDAAVLLDCLEQAYALATSVGRQIAVPLLTEVLQSAQFGAAIQQAAAKPQASGDE